MPTETLRCEVVGALKRARWEVLHPFYRAIMLRRMVTVAHCRTAFHHDIPIWEFAFQIDIQVRRDTKGDWRGLRMWQYYAAGECEIGNRALRLMEKAKQGTIKLNKHPFWRLIDGRDLRHKDLVEIVQKLPPKYAALCLVIRDSDYDFLAPNTQMEQADFDAIQSLGSLDAIAAMLALSRLFKEDYRMGGWDLGRGAAERAARLFAQLCLNPPFKDYAEEIWPLLRASGCTLS